MDVYLDNAATTQLDPEVWESMYPYMVSFCGNPSSVHRHGSQAKAAIERARKKIASLLNVAPSQILFTSGGTEGNNMLLKGVIEAMQIAHVLTSPLEHLAVRMPLEVLAHQGKIKLDYVHINEKGEIFLEEIEEWLKKYNRSLLSFMRVNHEIGNITDIASIGQLCGQYNAILHSDTVQSIYCLPHDFEALSLMLAVGSAHKLHGPHGIGFVYIHPSVSVVPLIYGGNQELNMRGGTENVASIVGMAKAVEISYRDREKIVEHLCSIKKYMLECLKHHIPSIRFNGHSESLIKSSPTLLNISLPTSFHKNDMLVYNLAIHGVAASTGSACTSGSVVGSSVIAALEDGTTYALRFSFSKYTTHEEIEETVRILKQLWSNC